MFFTGSIPSAQSRIPSAQSRTGLGGRAKRHDLNYASGALPTYGVEVSRNVFSSVPKSVFETQLNRSGVECRFSARSMVKPVLKGRGADLDVVSRARDTCGGKSKWVELNCA